MKNKDCSQKRHKLTGWGTLPEEYGGPAPHGWISFWPGMSSAVINPTIPGIDWTVKYNKYKNLLYPYDSY